MDAEQMIQQAEDEGEKIQRMGAFNLYINNSMIFSVTGDTLGVWLTDIKTCFRSLVARKQFPISDKIGSDPFKKVEGAFVVYNERDEDDRIPLKDFIKSLAEREAADKFSFELNAGSFSFYVIKSLV